MRSLFWKIFGWFWAAMVLIGLALYLVVLTVRPDPLPLPWRQTAGAAIHSYASVAAQKWTSGGKAELDLYLDEIGRRSQAHFWLMDAGGKQLGGGPIPPQLPDPGLLPPPDRPLPAPPPPEERDGRPRRWQPRGTPVEQPAVMQALVQTASHTEETIFEWRRPRVLMAQTINLSSSPGDVQKAVLIASLPQPMFGRGIADPRQQIVGGIALLLLSTLVCYGLVRYLTGPIISLREATRRLTAGDLTARTNAARHSRRDEVADLGRDFDIMAERMEALMSSQRRLLGDVSHELRSPLARLSMALALARHHAGAQTGEELNGALDRIGREKERLNQLIGQLLELVRLESGENSNEQGAIQLEELLKEIVQDAEFEARGVSRDIRIIQAQPCRIQGSQELLRSAVENVVRNAIAYTPEGTTVEVSLLREGKEALLQVRDRGAGVPEESLPKLFEPFYRVAEARDRQSGGVGLGLAITSRAVISHGGRVSARNMPEGGFQVELRLPLPE